VKLSVTVPNGHKDLVATILKNYQRLSGLNCIKYQITPNSLCLNENKLKDVNILIHLLDN